MGILRELEGKYKRIAIVGMAKNAGKTTTLNFLIEEAMDENIAIGVTSTGRDGENIDLVSGTEKPRIYLDEGTIVSVPVQLYELSDAGLEILRMTVYSTALGQIMLCRVAESGYVQISGPVNTADHKKMCEEMLALGAELILIDGAVDRKSIAAPETADGIILATGAVLSRSLKKIVEETCHLVNLYSLPLLEQGRIREVIQKKREEEKIKIIKKDEVLELKLPTGLLAGKVIDSLIDENTEAVYINGAMTGGMISDIHPGKLSQVSFILKDPTKIFIEATYWRQLCKKGFKVKVLENIKVIAVTVNPYAPEGYRFQPSELVSAMESALGDVPVIDVRGR